MLKQSEQVKKNDQVTNQLNIKPLGQNICEVQLSVAFAISYPRIISKWQPKHNTLNNYRVTIDHKTYVMLWCYLTQY